MCSLNPSHSQPPPADMQFPSPWSLASTSSPDPSADAANQESKPGVPADPDLPSNQALNQGQRWPTVTCLNSQLWVHLPVLYLNCYDTWLWLKICSGRTSLLAKKWPQMASWRAILHTCRKAQQKSSHPNKKHCSNTTPSALSQLPCPKENLLEIWLGRAWRKSRDCLTLMPSALQTPLYGWLGWLGPRLLIFSGKTLANTALEDNIPCLIITPTHRNNLKHSYGNPINL